MNSPPFKTLTNHEVVLLAVYLLGRETSPTDTEDIAVKADELAPGAFKWRKYPAQINMEMDIDGDEGVPSSAVIKKARAAVR